MPAERRPGMDHPHYDWSPFIKRGVLEWPEKARVALCVIVNLEHQEWSPPEGSCTSSRSGGLGARPSPDYARLSHREYGHRIGIFRVLDVLDRNGIRANIAMDALTAENYPYLVDHCMKRGCEIIAHGMSVSRMITGNMPEQEESEYIQRSLDALRIATGTTPAGWLGPEYGESAATPRLLAQAGIRYVCDWANDEQPYPMKTPGGALFALPIMLELDDVNALWDRRVPIRRYGQMLTEAMDTMHDEGARSGRLLVLNLHPWLIGQPFRIRYLDQALGAMVGKGQVWAATGSEIIDWFQRNPPKREA